MKKSESQSPKLDRKTVEKNRRIHMKGLCFKLSSLVPSHFMHPKGMRSQQDQLDEAAAYVMHMKERLEKLGNKKEGLKGAKHINNSNNNNGEMATFAVVEVKEFGSNIEIVVITDHNNNLKLSQVIKILEEEGAHVEAANFSSVGQKIFYFIHAQGWSGDVKSLPEIAGVGVLISSIYAKFIYM